MAFIPVNETVQAEVRMLLDDQKIENTLYFHKIGGFDVSAGVALANALLLWWTEEFRVQISNEVALREIYLTELSSIDSWTWTQAAPTPAPVGSQNLPATPSNVALCVSFRTAKRGRSYRGRNYIAGIPRDNVSSNEVSAGAATGLVSAYNSLMDLATDAGGQWVVVSRYHNNAPRAAGVHQAITSVVIVDRTVDSQRRRLPGRGS